jgi:hypothetical protein
MMSILLLPTALSHVLLPQPLGQVRVPTQKGASIAMRKSDIGDVAMLESWV